eukprot:13034660-Alexandrium_andersonii.AAC.1
MPGVPGRTGGQAADNMDSDAWDRLDRLYRRVVQPWFAVCFFKAKCRVARYCVATNRDPRRTQVRRACDPN